MLKIKDNVDLDVLKNYGFNYEDEDSVCIVDKWWEGSSPSESIYFKLCVNKETRIIEYDGCGEDTFNWFLDKLYDLIKDGIVEKVS